VLEQPTRDLFLLFLVLGSFLHGGMIIEGKTLNLKTGNPVVGVNISVESLDTGTVSDDSGNFVIETNGQDGIVAEFDHIAYETLYIPFTDSRSGVMVHMNEVLLQMDDVVVTSMRNGYLLRNVPINTEVIGKREIQGSGALTISELLGQRAGVSNSVNVDGGAIFNLLGLDSRYILILRDGQPITGRFNGRVDLDQISLTGIKKIEITKGPGSALYGTDAMGGTINIITDDPSESSFMNMSYRSTTFGRTLKAIKNDPVNNILSGSIVLPLRNLFFSARLNHQSFTRGQQFEYISADEITKLDLDASIEWKIPNTGHTIELQQQQYSQDESGATRLSSGAVLFTNTTDINREQSILKHTWSIKNIVIDQTLRDVSYSRRYLVMDTNDETQNNDLTGEDNREYKLLFTQDLETLGLNGGFEISRPRYISDRIAEGQQQKDQKGAFIQTDWRPISSMDIVSGLRFDQYGDRSVISPRFALAFSLSETMKYRIAYGHGFRAPSFMETLIDWEHVQFGYTVRGNPDLRPEVSKGITLGIEYTNRSDMQLSGLLYHNRFSDLIEDYSIEPGLLSYRNISEATFTGLELISKWSINSYLSSSITFNYIHNTDGSGKLIPNTVPISFGTRFSYSLPDKNLLFSLNLKGNGRYFPQEFDPEKGDYISSAIPIEPYLMADLQAQYKIGPGHKLIIGSKNIGDHTNRSYGPYIGRTAYIEIKTTVKRK